MADVLSVSPTRSTLLRLREELKQLREGYELLEHKREILLRELMEMVRDAEHVEAEAWERFRAAYQALEESQVHMGLHRMAWISLARTAEVSTQVTQRSVMGVGVPIVHVEVTPVAVPYSPGDTSVLVDEARTRWLEVLDILGQLAETVTTVWRLAAELKKTQRRVNALDHVLIPQYEATDHYITTVLEEQEREAFVQAKKVKAMRESREEGHD